MSPTLFDSHLHLTAGAFQPDPGEAVARAREAGVGEMVTVATDPTDARAALALASRVDGLWSTAGLHPHEAASFHPGLIDQIAAIAHEPGVVAIGEAGLDFHYDHGPRAAQFDSFEAQLALAEVTGLPIIVHSRAADADTARAVRDYAGRATGVLHCFTAGLELLKIGLGADWYVSFSGIVTFAPDLAEAVRTVPDERLLIETDSPYLAPEPRRGRPNEPSFLPYTCAAVAAIRGSTPERVADLTRRNARAFYRLDGESADPNREPSTLP